MKLIGKGLVVLILLLPFLAWAQVADQSKKAIAYPAANSTPITTGSDGKPHPAIVKVGIHLYGIDQLDLYKGTYAMDLDLILICQTVCPKFNLEAMNGQIQTMVQQSPDPFMKVYRMKAQIQDNFHSRNYPFDNYWLRLDLKDQLLDNTKLKFVVEPNLIFIDPKVVLHGWEFRQSIHAMTTDYIQPILNTVYSKYTFMFNLKRPILMGLLKVIFPSMIMILFAFLSFMINADKIINRFGIVSGALLGMVLFHINLTSSLPPLGYLTYVDAFMLINYIVLFMILFENLYVMRVVDKNQPHKAKEIDRVCIFILPLFLFVLQGLNIIYFFVP
jgi:hypothetical protein